MIHLKKKEKQLSMITTCGLFYKYIIIVNGNRKWRFYVMLQFVASLTIVIDDIS